jgi:hypothetical protein
MNRLLQRENLKKDTDVEAKEKKLKALEAKMKNGCTTFLAFVCVFILGMLVGMSFCGVKMA